MIVCVSKNTLLVTMVYRGHCLALVVHLYAEGEGLNVKKRLKAQHDSRYELNDKKLKELGLYGRNDLTLDEISQPNDNFKFIQTSKGESLLHGEGNLKFTSDFDGRDWWNRYGPYELVVSPNVDGTFTHVKDSNMGAYNFGSNPISHTLDDVNLYFIWGHAE